MYCLLYRLACLPACSTRAKKYFLVLMVGGMAAMPQAKGLDGGEPDEDEEGTAEVYVGHRKTKRRKQGHGDKVGRGWAWVCAWVWV
jgi:18S rRNA (guanine1575-N7)-methyltransferase